MEIRPTSRTQPLHPRAGGAPPTRPLGAGAPRDVLALGARLWTDGQAREQTPFLVQESRFLGVNHRLPAGTTFDMDDRRAIDAFARGSAPSALNARERYQVQAARAAIAAEIEAAGLADEGAALAAKAAGEPRLGAEKADLLQALDEGRLTMESPEIGRFNFLNEVLDAAGKTRDPRVTATAIRLYLAGDDAGLAGLGGSLELRNALAAKERQAVLEGVAQDAIRQVQGTEREALVAIGRLPAADQAEVRQLQAQTRHDPHARLALQGLLIAGKLGPGPEGRRLLHALGGMARAPLADGIDRRALVAETLQEIATPGAISQHEKGTCAVASLQIMVADQRPAEYVRILTGLAGPEGRVTLAGGQALPRFPGSEADDGSSRTTGARLWQAALMDFANGDRIYDAAADKTYDVDRPAAEQAGQHGLRFAELDRAVDALAGRDVPLRLRPDKEGRAGDPAAAAAWRGHVGGMLRDLARGRPATVSLEWGAADAGGTIHGGHQLVARAYDPATRTVTLQNPWGKTDRMALEEFERRLMAFEQVDFRPAR